MTWLILSLMTPAAYAGSFNIQSEWQGFLELPEPSDTTAVSVNPGGCIIPQEIHACDGEEGHYAATRLIPDATPFMVQQVSYALNHNQNTSLDCDANLDHEVFLFVAPVGQPLDPDPVELERHTVTGDGGSGSARVITIDLLNPIRLDAGESLVVAVEMAGDVYGGSCGDNGYAICHSICSGDETGEVSYWSGATDPAYSWSSLLDFDIKEDTVAYMSGFVLNYP
jgi:hypothetical protein